MNRKKLLKCFWKSIPKEGPSSPRGGYRRRERIEMKRIDAKSIIEGAVCEDAPVI